MILVLIQNMRVVDKGGEGGGRPFPTLFMFFTTCGVCIEHTIDPQNLTTT
jgi:hypothetical protein